MKRAMHPKLSEAKKNGVHCIVMDVDGTIVDSQDPRFTLTKAVNLMCKIAERGINVGIITARDASFRKAAMPIIQRYVEKENIETPLLVAYANGTTAEVITGNTIISLYSFLLNSADVTKILQAYDNTVRLLKLAPVHFNARAILAFKSFLKNPQQWDKYIPPHYVSSSLRYKGLLFIESSKLSIALPSDFLVSQKFKDELRKHLKDFTIRGDREFTHITKQIIYNSQKSDGKYFAAQGFLKYVGCNPKQIAAFGDSPEDNDKELLSGFEYCFTNNVSYKGKEPPYVLKGNDSPVALVYEAINYLL